MKGRMSSFGLMTRLGLLTGVSLLRDMFSNVNNKTNGFERNLRTGRYTRSACDRTNSTDFSGRQHGAKERERRLKHLRQCDVVSVTYVGPHAALKGKGALARDFDGKKVRIQMNDMKHPHAYGWWPYDAASWAVGFHGRIDNTARYTGA